MTSAQGELDMIPPSELAPLPSAKWRHVVEMAQEKTHSSDPVLILGEMGTARTQIARFIHHAGPRRESPLRGWFPLTTRFDDPRFHAFGGVGKQALGSSWGGTFPRCDGGSLLLDEAESFSVEQQRLVAQFLQDSRVFPVGSSESFTIDVRILLVGRDTCPKGEVRQERLLPPLWKRLKKTAIRIPPLRERREDIRPLLLYEINRIRQAWRREYGLEPESPLLTEEALEYIEKKHLPANGWTLTCLVHELHLLPAGTTVTRKVLEEIERDSRLDLDCRFDTGYMPSRLASGVLGKLFPRRGSGRLPWVGSR